MLWTYPCRRIHDDEAVTEGRIIYRWITCQKEFEPTIARSFAGGLFAFPQDSRRELKEIYHRPGNVAERLQIFFSQLAAFASVWNAKA